ncbi:hypothetical protein F5B22DRAFT_9313 [Xylaria bambusicola]|uniref:uncharacterized protein n=1 Tax=Xylaria bambusicola TaxID=326684 RepID=UPI002008066F|nr:uncharacterized protein F5B22DRAFT_9313 [Xylaria bambusicola]KAI0527890.1 hypothetical protein F5B22DRAFT_9313 [Xylaria bambusicola]
MATPDTSTLTSSAQVFTTYTLPQIRAIHKTLHTQIDEKSARLRTQVGSSYRQLLGTADTIVQMQGDMLSTQEVLGHMGSQCGRTVVEKKIMGLGRFRGNEDAEAALGQAARVKLLRACGLAVSRLLKTGTSKDAEGGRGDRLVLAAKVFVLSRLLVSSFGNLKVADEEIRSAVESAKKSLDGLRRKLVRAVEKVLQKVGEKTDITDIVKALSAYSLSSSSGTRDVLRRFLSIRAEAITYEFDYEEHEKDRGTDNVLRGLELYTKTLVEVQALVPNRLPEALLALKKKPLLADETLRSLEGLRLDIFETWCGDEIRYFTPFIRHDDLDGKQAKDMLMGWAKKGGETILGGLSKTLEHISEFKAIVELRTSTLQQWIRDGGKARGFDPSIMLDGLRKAINDHLLHLIETKVVKLKLVGSEVASTLEAWQSGITDRQRGLWDDEMLSIDFSIGAAQITHEVISRVYGRNDAVARAVTGFESWHHIIDNVGDLVEQLKRQRWDNDVDEIEDEETIEARQDLLSKDDPQLLHTRLNETLIKAFKDLDEQLTTLWQGRKDGLDNGQIAAYILRILRDIRRRLPKLEGVQSFGLDNVSSLHEKLAMHVSVAPLEEFTATTLTQKRVAGRALWEGEPPLPIQPSPSTFKLLRNVTTSMGDSGVDLWTPASVKTLKRVFSQQLAEIWHKELVAPVPILDEAESATKVDDDDNKDEAPTEEDKTAKETSQESSERSKNVFIQWLYDVNLLRLYLDNGGSDSKKVLKDLAAEVLEKTGLDSPAERRIEKASQEYWKRTSLLFSLLA